MNIDSSHPIVPTSCCKAILYKARYCYDKIKELAVRLFKYIASFFQRQTTPIPIPKIEMLSPASPIHLVIDLTPVPPPPEPDALSTDDIVAAPVIEPRPKTPSPPATPVSITSAVERRLKQDSPDTITQEVLESMSATPPGEQIVITVTPPPPSRRISPTGSVDSSGWVIDPI